VHGLSSATLRSAGGRCCSARTVVLKCMGPADELARLCASIAAVAVCVMVTPALAAPPIVADTRLLTAVAIDESEPAARPQDVLPPSAVDDARPTEGYRWRGPLPAQPDLRGAARDAGLFVSYQIMAVSVMYLAPESITNWSSEQRHSYDFKKWRDNVRRPVWDGDRWWINYVLHPYWGGTYYIRARERGFDRQAAFWYSALLSTLWEYGAEALAEPVSIQDLIVTPIAGALVGEYLFEPWRASIRAQARPLGLADQIVLAVTDPLGVVNAQVERWISVKSTLTVQPTGGRASVKRGIGHGAAALEQPDRWPSRGWRLQLRIQW